MKKPNYYYDTKKLNVKKLLAFELGNNISVLPKEGAIKAIEDFWKKKEVKKEKDGHMFEIMAFLLFGVIQQEAWHLNFNLTVLADSEWDDHQNIDLMLNHQGFQLKWKWDYDNPELAPHYEACEKHGVILRCYKSIVMVGRKKFNITWTEIVEDLFVQAGVSDKDIGNFFEESDTMFLAEELWSWFLTKLGEKVVVEKRKKSTSLLDWTDD